MWNDVTGFTATPPPPHVDPTNMAFAPTPRCRLSHPRHKLSPDASTAPRQPRTTYQEVGCFTDNVSAFACDGARERIDEGERCHDDAPGTASKCNPQANVSTDGSIVHVSLDLVRAHFTMFNPASGFDDPVELRSYGGCVTGPTIEVDPGTVLRVDLNNKLSADDPTCLPNPPAYLHLYPGVGCFNTANLHTHGLHVSPAGNSDNVLLNIAPQTTFPYEINIPYDHPAGTFW
jgi:hypothetical protein